MNENENEIIDSTNDTTEEETDIELELEDNEESEEETITIPKKKWTEALAKQEHWKKKATTPAKTEVQATQTEQLSVKDSYALVKADVNEEDIEDVIEYAKFKKITIAEALKSNVVKSMLAEKDEFRKSQEASTTANTRKAQAKVTPDVILENARKGKLGDSEEEIRALFRARMNIK
jgi:hypothetical protein